MPLNNISEIKEALPRIRRRFEMDVESASIEVTEIAKRVSEAIGEISIDEAREAIIQEFRERLKNRRITWKK